MDLKKNLKLLYLFCLAVIVAIMVLSTAIRDWSASKIIALIFWSGAWLYLDKLIKANSGNLKLGDIAFWMSLAIIVLFVIAIILASLGIDLGSLFKIF